MVKDYKGFVAWLNRVLLEDDIPLSHVADNMGCDYSYLWKVKNYKAPNVSERFMLRIASALDRKNEVYGVYTAFRSPGLPATQKQKAFVIDVMMDNTLPESETRKVLWKYGCLLQGPEYHPKERKDQEIDYGALEKEAMTIKSIYLSHLDLLRNTRADEVSIDDLLASFEKEFEYAMNKDLQKG